MKNILQLSSLLIMLLIFSIGFFHLNKKIEQKVAVINIQDTYKSFEMTKAMSQKFKLLTSRNTQKVDSLNLLLESFSNLETGNRNVDHISKILKEADLYQQDKDKVKYELEQQIWSQLNQYLIEYGQRSEYALIHGSVNEGNILYADDPVDITEDVIAFVNNKYKGIE